MSLLKDVLFELLGMFVSDARLTAAVLFAVMVAAVLIKRTGLPPLAGGAFLLVGCVAILVMAVRREARLRAARAAPPACR